MDTIIDDMHLAICGHCGHKDRIDLSTLANNALTSIGLSDRERSIAQLMLKGFANKEIAKVLNITEKTVKHHVVSVFRKSRVCTRGEFFHLIFPT